MKFTLLFFIAGERLQLGNADLVSAVDANATAAQEDDD